MGRTKISVIALNMLAAARAGTFWGIDGMLEQVQRRAPQVRYVLG
ncbi:MAG: hypothetical protein V3U79_04935 [Dehalococcoidia bacterium]